LSIDDPIIFYNINRIYDINNLKINYKQLEYDIINILNRNKLNYIINITINDLLKSNNIDNIVTTNDMIIKNINNDIISLILNGNKINIKNELEFIYKIYTS
jgi:hypothetical protein